MPDGASTFSVTIVPSQCVLLLGGLAYFSSWAEGAVLDWCKVFLRELRQVDIVIGHRLRDVLGGGDRRRVTGDRLIHGWDHSACCSGSAVGAASYLCARLHTSRRGRAYRIRPSASARPTLSPCSSAQQAGYWYSGNHRAGHGHDHPYQARWSGRCLSASSSTGPACPAAFAIVAKMLAAIAAMLGTRDGD